MHWDADGNLVLLSKRIEVFLFDGRVEIIYSPQREHDELLKPIRTYDGLKEGLNTK